MFDHELKINRALQQIDELDSIITDWKRGGHYSVRYEYDPDAKWDGPIPSAKGCRVYRLGQSVFIPGQDLSNAPQGLHAIEFGQGYFGVFASAEQPPKNPISLLIGEILHHLRSGLDALAFSLAVGYLTRQGHTVTRHTGVTSEFPIFGNETRKGNPIVGRDAFHATQKDGITPSPQSGLAKISACSPFAQTEIERLQPYQRGNRFREDPLWILQELDNANKHRLLHTGVVDARGLTTKPSEFENVFALGPGFIQVWGGTVDTDTPIGRIYGIQPIDPEYDVKVNAGAMCEIVFSESTPCVPGDPVSGVLHRVYAHITKNVIPALTPYL